MSGFDENIKNEYLKLLKHYDRLGWKIIPLEGKRPFWKEWDNPEKWRNGGYSNEETINEIITSRFRFNVGILTGEQSKIIRIDIDQPKILGWNPEPAIKKGALAHTTSRGPALVVRSDNPEVLAFSKKLTKRRDEIDENLLFYEEDKEKTIITIIEILGNGRQFVAPPSIHPDKKIRYEWLTSLPETPEQILTINSIEELYTLLLECCKNKELINELFEDYFTQKAREETGEECRNADELLEKWLKIILNELQSHYAGETPNYYVFHCPFHPPDGHPSFAIHKTKYYAVDYHNGQVYSLKKLAEALGIELPKGSRGRLEDRLKEFGLDKYGITADDLKELSMRIIDIHEKKDGEVVVKGIKHGEFAQWLRERFHFATNSITEEIWMYHDDEGVWRPDGESFIKKICELILNALGYPEFATIRRIAEVVHHIKRYPQIHPNDFNKAWREGWVNCINGVVNIFTGEFREHRPEDFFTWRINAEYNPDAKGEVVEKFLESLTDDRELLEEIIAYCLLPGQPLKKFFVIVGPTNTGKSTFLYLIESFLGKENCSALSLHDIEIDKFARANLIGKLANLGSELPTKRLDKCPTLKKIVGGDTVFVQKKFQQGYDTKIDAKLIFTSNVLPEVDEGDSFWDRVVIVQFLNQFPRNDGFKQNLTQPNELSALLNLVLRAIPRLLEKKFETGDISRAVKIWRLASDPLGVFIEEKIEIIYTADDDFIDNEIYEFKFDVFRAFQEFCSRNGVESRYATNYHTFIRAFTKKLGEKGIRLSEGRKERDRRKEWIWWGIRLKRDEENDEDQNSTPPDNNGGGDNNGNGNGGDSNDSGERRDIQDFSIESAMGLSRDDEEVWNEFVESAVSEHDTKEQDTEKQDKEEDDKSTDDDQSLQEHVNQETAKDDERSDVDSKLIQIYNNFKKSVPADLLPKVFIKAVRNEFGSIQAVKDRIDFLVKKGKLPKSFLNVEETIRVKALDYIHIVVNGQEYRADSGKILEMPLKDYESLHPEVRGFLIPIDADEGKDCNLDEILDFDLEIDRETIEVGDKP